MLSEINLRRNDFHGGLPVRLADDQYWAFPGPREIAPGGGSEHPKVLGLLAEVAESEDEFDRGRGELALAIHLLALNYVLGPDELQSLLRLAPNDPRLPTLRSAFHELAVRHMEALAAPADPKQNTQTRRFRLPFFRPAAPKAAPARIGGLAAKAAS